MRDPEIERAAEFLAAYAVLLLGIGVFAALASLTAIVLAVRSIVPFLRPLLAAVTWLEPVHGLNRALCRFEHCSTCSAR